MKRNWRKLIVRATLAILSVVAVCLILYTVELKRSEAELRVVLSDLVSEALAHRTPDSPKEATQLVILSNAAQPGIPPGHEEGPRWRTLLNEKSRFPQASAMTRFSFLLTNFFPTKIKANLHLPNGAEVIVWEEKELKRGEFDQLFPRNGGRYLTISQAGFNLNRTAAILFVNLHCGGLCGGGNYYLLRKIDGVWHVAETHEVWVS
jgi:hypothetical protein